MAKIGRKSPEIFAVITGDIVDSSRVSGSAKAKLAGALEDISKELDSVGCGVASLDIFRGDSFQIILEEAGQIIDAALFIRVWFHRVSISGTDVLDARLGLGLGPVEYHSKNESLSDGTAFRLAAQSLEMAYQDKLGNIRFASEFKEPDPEVNAILIAMEPYLSTLTRPQAEALWWSMTGLTHSGIANKLDVAQSTVTRALQSAHNKHIAYLRAYLHACVETHLSHKPQER
jgi:hypothetical protein